MDAKSGLRRFSLGVICCLAVMVCAAPAFATGVTLPDTGVDLEGTVTAMVTTLGACIAAVVAAYCAFKLIKVGLRWFGQIGG